jgi:hypothetical protein
LEVQSRPAPHPRALSGRLALTRALPALALAAVVAASLAIVVAQPVRSPWWTYADADATYTASGLNLLIGVPVRYLDHPGLPLEETIAVVFGVDELVQRLTGDVSNGQEFVDGMLLDLDRTRPFFRTLAILFYLAGGVLAFVLLARLFGHWSWGFAGGLLWIAAPGLAAMSIQFRPDVALAVLCLVVAYLLGRAVETRSALLYGAAATVLGLAMMVKLHAAGLIPALALAALWRPPAPGWARQLREDVGSFARRRRRLLLAGAAAWVALAAILGLRRLPFELTPELVLALVGPGAVLAAYSALCLLAVRLEARGTLRRLADPFLAFLGGALFAGLLVPVTLDVPDGMRSLGNIAKGLTGGGVNEPVEPFSAPLDRLLDFPLRQALVLFLLAGVGAVVGLRRRDARPVVWFVGAAVLGVMGEARLAATHYFAPAFVVSLPAALWLLQRRAGRATSLLVWVLVAYAVVPQLDHRHAPAVDEAKFEAQATPALAYVESHLRPGEVALTPSYWPHPDPRYWGVVELYVAYTPDYPYRLLPASRLAAERAGEQGKRLRFYADFGVGKIHGEQQLQLADIGTFTVRRASDDVVELVAGPGVDAPLVPQ